MTDKEQIIIDGVDVSGLNTQNAVVIDMSKRLYGYRKALEEIQTLTGKIISNDDQPACVMDTECPLNGGVGFDNHCNENCPLILAKQILNIINKAKGGEIE